MTRRKIHSMSWSPTMRKLQRPHVNGLEYLNLMWTNLGNQFLFLLTTPDDFDVGFECDFSSPNFFDDEGEFFLSEIPVPRELKFFVILTPIQICCLDLLRRHYTTLLKVAVSMLYFQYNSQRTLDLDSSSGLCEEKLCLYSSSSHFNLIYGQLH